MKPWRRMMPRSVYWPLLHMSFSPALHCGHLPHGRRTVETTRSPGLPALHLLADLLDDAEVLVAEDQELVAVGRLAVEPVVDLGVGAAEADAQHLHRDLIRLHLRIRHVAHVDAVFLAGLDDDGFHDSPHLKSVRE